MTHININGRMRDMLMGFDFDALVSLKTWLAIQGFIIMTDLVMEEDMERILEELERKMDKDGNK